MTLGENLQRLRKEKGLSQEEVAQRLFVSRQSVSKWELDQAEPGVEYLKALAGLYGVSLDGLAGMPSQPEPIPEEAPDPDPEEESGVSFYRTVFGVRTVTAVLSNVLFSFPRGSVTFPFDWVAMLVGLFVRKPALWWVTEVCLWLNVAINILHLLGDLGLGIIGLIQAGAFLGIFFSRKLKAYFHMPQSE